jgi:serine/threonine protein kinase
MQFSDRYAPLRRLGSGSQGVAYLCVDRRAPASRAVMKLSHSAPEALAALETEVRALHGLRGTVGVPELRALVRRDGQLRGFLLPYRPGVTLDRVLSGGRLPTGRALALSIAIADAVLGVADRGYVHRDVKPENLLCLDDGGVLLIDFGLARPRAETAPDRSLSGTLAYAAPEQITGGSVDSSSDLFSLGVVLYEVATGEPLFSRDAGSISEFLAKRRIRLGEPLVLEGVPPLLSGLVRRLVVESPALRAGIAEVHQRLDGLRSLPRDRVAG